MVNLLNSDCCTKLFEQSWQEVLVLVSIYVFTMYINHVSCTLSFKVECMLCFVKISLGEVIIFGRAQFVVDFILVVQKLLINITDIAYSPREEHSCELSVAHWNIFFSLR